MSKREHTPGEWTIADDDGVQVPFIPIYAGSIGEPTYKDICKVACSLDGDDEFVISEEDRANARLIAAAPDMLEALEALLAHYIVIADSGDCGFWEPRKEPVVIAAQAAISKATGGGE